MAAGQRHLAGADEMASDAPKKTHLEKAEPAPGEAAQASREHVSRWGEKKKYEKEINRQMGGKIETKKTQMKMKNKNVGFIDAHGCEIRGKETQPAAAFLRRP